MNTLSILLDVVLARGSEQQNSMSRAQTPHFIDLTVENKRFFIFCICRICCSWPRVCVTFLLLHVFSWVLSSPVRYFVAMVIKKYFRYAQFHTLVGPRYYFKGDKMEEGDLGNPWEAFKIIIIISPQHTCTFSFSWQNQQWLLMTSSS